MDTSQDILDYLSKVFRSGDATTPRHIVALPRHPERRAKDLPKKYINVCTVF
jgi:hypothetical protein